MHDNTQELQSKIEDDQHTGEQMVSLRVKKSIVDLIDKERSKYSSPRSSWIIQSVVEKLERLGYDIK
jgi:hypothetical protein